MIVSIRYVVVAAYEHAELDDWVKEEALQEAERSGLVLGDYLGRETVLSGILSELKWHVFIASKEE